MQEKEMTFPFAACLLGLVLAVILLPALLLGSKVQPLFLIAWALAVVLLMAKGYTWGELMDAAALGSQKAFSPILFLLCAGAMIGTWNACGTIPMLTLFGISHMSAGLFLVLAFAGCFVFGIVTGTVFGVCGTVGVMFLAVGRSLNIPDGWGVAAVAAGAFFGYGLSPLADCTNLVSSTAGVPLSACIRSQFPVLVPVLAALAAVYGGCGMQMFSGSGALAADQLALVEEIEATFRLGFWPVVPPVLVVALLLMKRPAMLSILAGAGAGALVHFFYQGKSAAETVSAIWIGPDFSASGETVQSFFGGGGMSGMSGTVILFLLAFGLFGVLDGCGAVKVVMDRLLTAATTQRRAAVITMLFGFGLNIICASAMCSFIFTLSCLLPLYETHGWDKTVLGRSSFVGCLYMSLFIPWHSNIMTASSLLGVEGNFLLRELALPAAAVVVLFLLWTFFAGTIRGEK